MYTARFTPVTDGKGRRDVYKRQDGGDTENMEVFSSVAISNDKDGILL